MTPEQVRVVQATFAKIIPIAQTAADMFYQRLFETAPHLQPLFRKTNMRTQGNKLIEMIGTAVAGLNDLEALKPSIKQLGARHASYGVKPEDYQRVGAALLWTLEQGLGSEFTDEVKEAWAAVYKVISQTAISGVEEPA